MKWKTKPNQQQQKHPTSIILYVKYVKWNTNNGFRYIKNKF